MKKKIMVTIKEPPGGAMSEKLRMSVGLTLDDNNEVSVLLIDDGVYTGLGMDEEKVGSKKIDKHLEMLEMMNVKVFAHEGSVKGRDVFLSKFGVEKVDDDEVARLLFESDVTI